MNLCPECDEVVEDPHRYHAECCAHDEVERFDDRDSAYGRVYHWCHACGSEVTLTEPDEDGHSNWETV